MKALSNKKTKILKGTQSLICGNGTRRELRENGPNYYIPLLIRMFYNTKVKKNR